MQLATTTIEGKKGSALTVSDKLFTAKPNRDLVYQVVTSQMANKRQILAHTKDRSEVRGGGKKPWAQKGTGRARHGSIRSPIWVGGGVAHGPTKEVNFKRKITRTQGRAALATVLSARLAEERLIVVESLAVPTGKTKDAVALLAKLTKGVTGRVLVVLAGTEGDKATRRAMTNLPKVDVMRAQDLNALSVLSFPTVLASAEGISILESQFAKNKAK
jgi:large subunit ribosomal protein L4